MVMKSFSATFRSVACSATVGARPATSKVRETPRTERMFVTSRPTQPRETAGGGLEQQIADQANQSDHDDAKDDLVGQASSAWLSVIMWPMPLEAPISSATMT